MSASIPKLIARCLLGLGVAMLAAAQDATEQVVIIGGGPAAYTAALYAARADLKPLVIEGLAKGGQLLNSPQVENYPGYPDGVSGLQMMEDFRWQAQRFGARFLTCNATALQPGAPHQVTTDAGTVAARTVILAMGSQHRQLGVPGEAQLSGQGVSYCAICDAPFFRGKDVVVVGGGDSAMDEALILAKFARQVTIVHRRPEFRASRIMLDRARAHERIKWLTPYAVQAFQAGPQGSLAKVILQKVPGGEVLAIPAGGAFIAVGQVPQTEWLKGAVDLDGRGYVLTQGPGTHTRVPGLFAAGDLVDHTYRQAVTAASAGCMAALDAERYLRDNP